MDGCGNGERKKKQFKRLHFFSTPKENFQKPVCDVQGRVVTVASCHYNLRFLNENFFVGRPGKYPDP